MLVDKAKKYTESYASEAVNPLQSALSAAQIPAPSPQTAYQSTRRGGYRGGASPPRSSLKSPSSRRIGRAGRKIYRGEVTPKRTPTTGPGGFSDWSPISMLAATLEYLGAETNYNLIPSTGKP